MKLSQVQKPFLMSRSIEAQPTLKGRFLSSPQTSKEGLSSSKSARSGNYIIIPGFITSAILQETSRSFIYDKAYGKALSFFESMASKKKHSPELDMADKLMGKAYKENGPKAKSRHFSEAYDYYEKVAPSGLAAHEHDAFDQNYAQGLELVVKPHVYPDSTTTLNEIRAYLNEQPSKNLFRDGRAHLPSQKDRSEKMGIFDYGSQENNVLASTTPYLSKDRPHGIVSRSKVRSNAERFNIYLPKVLSSLVKYLPTESERNAVTNRLLTANELHVVNTLGENYGLKYYLNTELDQIGNGQYSDSKYRIADWATPPFTNHNAYREINPRPYDDPDTHFGNIG